MQFVAQRLHTVWGWLRHTHAKNPIFQSQKSVELPVRWHIAVDTFLQNESVRSSVCRSSFSPLCSLFCSHQEKPSLLFALRWPQPKKLNRELSRIVFQESNWANSLAAFDSVQFGRIRDTCAKVSEVTSVIYISCNKFNWSLKFQFTDRFAMLVVWGCYCFFVRRPC